ncbi:MAG TPA: hypothetical protein VF173_26000 [Thermoanaerobaculia bacterium]|nr:hypothetical protein [Thermoanaerobaculia bacterium]
MASGIGRSSSATAAAALAWSCGSRAVPAGMARSSSAITASSAAPTADGLQPAEKHPRPEAIASAESLRLGRWATIRIAALSTALSRS